MSRNERMTCRELIEPALSQAGWQWDEQLRIGPGRVNISGETMYDPTQAIIADYLLRYRGIPLVILEAKAEGESAADGMQQASRYAARLLIRFSLASNGADWILTDNDTGQFETLTAPPTPDDIVQRHGVTIDWNRWEDAFAAGFHVDQVTRKKVRPYQEMAIAKTLWQFAQGIDRVLLLMATGTGKTFTVFQLVWKLMNGHALKREHVLFLTDRNSLKDQAYRAFSAFSAAERVTIDKETVANGQHLVGKIFFANYQTLDEELNGKKVYEHFDADFFDLVVVDECHRSGFGDWFGVLEHFGDALQLGLTATPRELEETARPLTFFQEDDVLFAKITPCMQNGKSAIARGLANGLGFGSTEFHVIRPNMQLTSPEWLWFFVRQQEFRQEGIHHFRGAVGQQRVPPEYLASAKIPLPPLPEQRRIVARIKECMERVDEIEQLRAGAVGDAYSLESAVFADFIESLDEHSLGETTLGDVVIDCKYGTSKKANTQGQGVPVLRMGNIQNGRLDLSDLKFVSLPDKEMAKYLLEDGDILINRTNSLELVGKSAVFEKEKGDWVYASYLVRIRVDENRALPEYVNAVINSRIGRDFVYRTARRAIGMVNINAKEMQRFPLPLPSLQTQEHLIEQMQQVRPLAKEVNQILGEDGYHSDFPLESQEADVSVDAASEYRAMLEKLTADDLPRFEARFKELLNVNTINEVVNFQGQLARERETIKDRIEHINKSLAQIDYNPGRYIVLEAQPTQDADVRDFQSELRACTEDVLTGSDDDQYSEAKFLQVRQIVERFRGREGQSDQDARWTARVTNVRKWFVFAASERWREDNTEYEHYSDSGGKSGGQKEKLAYTVLAASLAYQFGLEWGETRSRSFRLVVIDEAFGRGSDESAQYGLELFSRLNLQLLIVTPLQKIHIIEPYVSNVGFVHNEDGRASRLRNLSIEEYREEKARGGV